MKFRYTFTLCVIFNLCMQFSTAQTLPGIGWEGCMSNGAVRALAKVSDTAYAVAAAAFSCDVPAAIKLQLLNKTGKVLWAKDFADYEYDLRVFSLANTNDGGFILCGYENHLDQSSYNLIIKTNGSGDTLWTRKFFFGNVGIPVSGKIIEAADGGYCFAGDVYGEQQHDINVIKMDANGNVLWNKTFGGSQNDFANDVIESDDGFLISGVTSSNDEDVTGNHGLNDAWLLKLDLNGNLVWKKCYGGSYYDEAKSIIKTNDGKFIIAGSSTSNDGDVTGHHGSVAVSDYWIFSIDAIGNLLWSKSFGGTDYDFASQIVALSDSEFVISGSSYSADGDVTNHHGINDYDDLWLVGIDASGNVLWENSIGGTDYDHGNGVVVLNADEIIVAGNSLSADGNHTQNCLEESCYNISEEWMALANAHCSQVAISDFTYEASSNQITFTDASTGTPASWLWNFGDGTTSTLQNPVHVFALGNSYKVCLTVAAANCATTSESCNNVVLCSASANASFAVTSFDNKITFENSSLNSVTYNWNFGDGTTSTEEDPVHEYPAGVGIYNAILIASDNCGSDTTYKTIYIGLGVVTSSFSFLTFGLSVAFTNLSTNAVSYLWTFGDGNSSTEANPFHTYSANGLYHVCLVAYDQFGNSDTSCQDVALCINVDADYEYSATNLITEFTDQSVAATQWLWNFDDGFLSSFQNPIHTFQNNSTYNVCLIATNVCSQSDTFCKLITVCGALAANFNYTQSYLNVTFSDLTVAATSWFWIFGDGQTSVLQNPVHNYAASGNYTVNLVVSDACGQYSSFQKIISVCNPVIANYNYSAADLAVTFTDQTIAATQWHWDFGDGDTSSLKNPVHTFLNNGFYTVCLATKDNCGYMDTLCKLVTVCAPIATNFGFAADHLAVSFSDSTINASSWVWYFGDGNISYQQNPDHNYLVAGTYEVCLVTLDICNHSSILCKEITVCDTFETAFSFSSFYLTTFYNDLTASASEWSWDFGDGNFSDVKNPVHTYSSNGVYSTCLTATDVCGYSDIACNQVTVCAPLVSNFSFSNNFLTASFVSLSPNGTQWKWYFGDGNISTEENPTHIYISNGIYNVCFVVTDLCGQTDSVCKEITVCAPLDLDFSWQQNNLQEIFTNQSSNTIQWYWDFGDGQISTEENPVHVFPVHGEYEVCLIAFDLCGSDTLCKLVDVVCPPFDVDFSYSVSTVNVDFTDLTANAIEWLWNFGDGGDAIEQNPTHQFPDTGSYEVCLIAYDSCSSDTMCKMVTIVPVGVNEITAAQNEFEVFPNPAKTVATISFSVMKNDAVKIILEDVNGRLIQLVNDEDLIAGKYLQQIQLEDLSEGIYLVRIVSQFNNAVKKLIVQ